MGFFKNIGQTVLDAGSQVLDQGTKAIGSAIGNVVGGIVGNKKVKGGLSKVVGSVVPDDGLSQAQTRVKKGGSNSLVYIAFGVAGIAVLAVIYLKSKGR